MTASTLTVIDEHKSDLIDLCREFGIERLELFGSATGDAFDPERSDLDFLVTYSADADLGPWMVRFQELQERLSELFGREVDLVMAKDFRNPYFARSVQASRVTIYA